VRDDMLAEVSRLGIQVLPLVRLYGADQDTVYFQDVLTGEPVVVDDVASLVLAQGHTSVDDLLRSLELPDTIEVRGVGDCLAPRTVEEAVLDGLRVATAL
jgi:hypothetical protein